jgi:hypothetical protein
MAFPARIQQGDGSPIRVVAILDPDQHFRVPRTALGAAAQ